MVGTQKMLAIIVVRVLDSLNLLYLFAFFNMTFESRKEVFGKVSQ